MSDPKGSNEHHHPMSDFKKVTRREFLDYIIRGGLLATLAGMILPALAYLWPVTRRGPSFNLKEVGLLEDIPIGGAKKIVSEGSAILVIRTQKGVKAFSAICTHLGCVVEWDAVKKEILCPCHAGIFDVEGKVVAGPPPLPLPTLETSISDGKVFVKT